MKTAAVIGAGFGGLALAIRLQSAGIATTLVEARDTPGGCAHGWERDGFRFDAGPATITNPGAFAELWRLSGRDFAGDVELLPVTPFHRLLWPDGTSLDLSGDDAAVARQIAAISPEDVAGYRRFLAHGGEVHAAFHQHLARQPFLRLADMARTAAPLIKHQAWRSAYATAASFVKHPRLREALSFQALLVGGNPVTAGGLHAPLHRLERENGVWFPRGGVEALARAMASHFERLGGVIRLGDAVTRIEMLGDHATGLACASGWRGDFDAVASNADPMHSYRDLLAHSTRGERAARALARRSWSPALFAVHFGIRGSFPGIPHRTTLFGPRYRGLMTDIFDHGVLSRDFLLHLHHPSVTDPALAPEGCSVFTALSPVPNLGRLPVDWAEIGPAYAGRILDHLEARLIPGLRERLVLHFHRTPAQFGQELNAHLGAAFGLEPKLGQTGWFRVHNRDDRIDNLYFVGASTHPGPGVPGVVASAGITATLMLDDLRRS